MISQEDIAAYIDAWKDETLDVQADGTVGNEGLGEYIDTWIDGLKEIYGDIVSESMTQKHRYELSRIREDTRYGDALVAQDIVQNCYNYVVTRYNDESDLHFCATRLVRSMLDNFLGLFSDQLAGIRAPSAAHLRMMYEAYDVGRFISKHPELARPFRDHGVLMQRRTIEAFGAVKPGSKIEFQSSEIIDRYGKDFAADFGWTAPVIGNKRNRRLATLAKDAGLSDYRSMYVLGSGVIHASAFTFGLTALSSEFWGAIVLPAIELVSNGVVHLMRTLGVDDKTRILLMNLLCAYREDVLGEPRGRD